LLSRRAIDADYHSVVTHGPRSTLRVATYNIHRCRGLDGRTRPDRIAAVLRTIDADVIALQEVIGAGPHGGGHAEELGALLGMGWVMSPARQLRGHHFGNAVLSRHPIAQHLEHDLSWKTCEARRLQRVDIAADGCTLHLYNVHLGTAILERRHQAQKLASIVSDRHIPGPKLVVGDFNEWMRGLATNLLSEKLNSVDLRNYLRRKRTYPGLFPILHLDHIYYAGKVEILGIELPRTRLSLVASDHLPLVADVRIG
jgi:endonuclease/exonuclease/phosphatase family metal-dependent hydrolase